MCNCYSEITEKLTERARSQLPEGAMGLAVALGGYAFGITSTGMTHRAALPAAIEFQAPKKTGGFKTVRQKPMIHATFCPFCGEKYAA